MSERPRISSRIVGAEVGPIDHTLDPRWLMAYAAGIGERAPCYYDTRAARGPVAHPLFPVSYEWPAALAIRAKTVDSTLAPLSVHATHHGRVHRSPRAGDTVRTSARRLGEPAAQRHPRGDAVHDRRRARRSDHDDRLRLGVPRRGL